MNCPNCGTENPAEAGFCLNCGTSLNKSKELNCPFCGTALPPSAKYCFACGKEIGDPVGKDKLSAIQSVAPKGLQQKMKAAGSEIEGERKPVTILFTDIVGSTSLAEQLDPEEWKEVVSGAHRRVGEAIYRYEGTIAQLLGDGVLAFFGAPIIHEDDPIRAVHAALEIQESMHVYRQELSGVVDNFQMRIGINAGTVVIGDIGTDMHMEYLALGDAVNVAARLQSAADPGKILISERCARMLGTEFALADLGEIEVKGRKEPLSVFEVIGVKEAPESQGDIEAPALPLVGREDELQTLKEAVVSLCHGHGRVLTVLGEAGIGKSRLVEEVRYRSSQNFGMVNRELDGASFLVAPSSLNWLEARALSYGSSLSFWILTQLLLSDLGLPDSTPSVKIRVALRRRMKELFDDDNPDVLPTILHLLGLSEEVGEEGGSLLEGESLKSQTLEAVKEYFAAVAAEGPTVLALEDMHWADPSSLEALEAMLSITDRAPLLILMIMRVDREHGSWKLRNRAETNYAHRYTEIHLRSLTEEMSHRLVNQLLGIEQSAQDIHELILTRSEGNPLYLEEVINHLKEQSLIVQDDQGWRVEEEVNQIGIPDTLQGVLLARIDRLEEDVRRTLQMASVIGKSFLFRLLEAISEAERELEEHLSQLQRVDLVREKALIPELEYMFKHSLTQEAAYSSLLHERRMEFHQKVGEALEDLFVDRMEEFLGLIAYHFEAADDQNKALDYLIRAGDQARLTFALQEAIDFYQRALVILKEEEDFERSARTLMKLGLTHHNALDFQKARLLIDESFEIRQQAKETRPTDLPPAPHPFRLPFLDPITLDPSMSNDRSSGFYVWKIFSGLMTFDSEWEIIPEVAQSWEVSEDGRRYLFHLQNDVFWSDGTQVTAEDFVYSLQRTLNPSINAPEGIVRTLYAIRGARAYHKGEVSGPDQVGARAIDALTLEYELESPASYFLQAVAYQFPIPRHIVEEHGDAWTKVDNIVTNGPFLLESYQPGERLTLVRNPTYHGLFSGNLQRVEAQLNVNRLTFEELEIYQSNGADMIQLGTETYHLRHQFAEEYISEPSPATHFIKFDLSSPPFDDVRVRQAFVMAIDKIKYADEMAGGFSDPATGGFIPPGAPGHSRGIGLPFDPAKARLLLQQAGYPDGQGFPRLELATRRSVSSWADFLTDQWMDNLNVSVAIKAMDSAEFREGTLDTKLSYSGWILDYPDPDNFLGVCVRSHVPDWRNEVYDRLLEEAQRISNLSDRIDLYQEADRILMEEAAIVPIIYYRYHFLVKPWVKVQTEWGSSWTWKDVIIEPH